MPSATRSSSLGKPQACEVHTPRFVQLNVKLGVAETQLEGYALLAVPELEIAPQPTSKLCISLPWTSEEPCS